MEDEVNKTIVTSAGALLAAVTMLSSTAEAGFKFHIGLGFPIGGYSHPSYEHHPHWRERVYVERKARRVHVAKKKSPTTTAVVQEQAPADTVAVENENSSISVAALPATDAATNPATAEDTSATPLQPVTPPQKDAAVAPTDLPVTKATEQATETPIDAPPLPAVDQKLATPAVPGQKTAKKLDCKTFFPSVGLTLSVPCG
jgi:hypothetical protein